MMMPASALIVIVEDDPCRADERMTSLLSLPFTPPYLKMITQQAQRAEALH